MLTTTRHTGRNAETTPGRDTVHGRRRGELESVHVHFERSMPHRFLVRRERRAAH